MTHFDKLNALITSLTTTEKSFCHDHLEAFSELDEHEVKSLQLFDLLQKHSQITENEAELMLYEKNLKGLAFTRLQMRLLYKILNLLSGEQQMLSENTITARVRTRILVRHHLNHADLLITRKLYVIATDVLSNIISTTEKYELFDEQLSAAALEITIVRLEKEETKAAEIALKVLQVRQRISVITAADQLLECIRQPEWMDVDERLKQLHQNAKESPSATCIFLVMNLEAIQMKEQCEYAAAAELFQQQLTFALQHPALTDHYLTNKIYQHLAACATYMRRYDKALDILTEAIHEHRLDRWQEEVVFIRFHVLFYKKNYEEALRMISNEVMPEYLILYNYWSAACYFMQNEYHKAFQCMQRVSFFELALHNCGAWPMFLLQMATIEVGLLSKAKLKHELVRIRLRYTAELLGREEKADQFMKQLIKYDFDFERAALKCRTQMAQLKARTGDFCFEIFSGELVVFQKWVMQKSK